MQSLLSTIFEPRTVRRPPYSALLREVWSVLTCWPSRIAPETLPNGGGRPVLVIPGFLCGDLVSLGFRNFLDECGFRAFGWGLGVNWGPTQRILDGLDRRVAELHEENGPIALVGISLGGLLAWNVAHDHPDRISHVVTVASPIRLPTASTLEVLVRLCAGRYSPSIDPARLARPLPMPCTTLWTQDDGIVAPETCWNEQTGAESVALRGGHLMLASTPDARRALVRRLAP
jgi:pimeloyl-ACP methyl ester carboxylesterase